MKVSVKQENYNFDAEQVLEREVKPFSKSSAHIILPKKLVGQNVIVIVLAKAGQWLKGYRKKYANEKKESFP